VYWVGPFLGALLAVLFYRLVKILEYETANPGADSDGQRRASQHGSTNRGLGNNYSGNRSVAVASSSGETNTGPNPPNPVAAMASM
jgi:hypothetical protein